MATDIATPQTAAHAALTDPRRLVLLLVKPSYKKRWHLPGGFA
ncbi:hypothetical protein [Actinomadura darangshiensis]|nr:hypothetical protein [Actinomadura darangshiensis]